MTVRSTIQLRDNNGVIRHGGEWLVLWSDPDSLQTAGERRKLAAQRLHARAEAERIGAAARALSGNPQFRPPPSTEETGEAISETISEDLAARRGRADSAALQSRFHAAGPHQSLRPSDRVGARLFDLCERVRCECLGALRMPGVAGNLVAAQKQRLHKADLLNAHLASLVPVTEALEMTLRDVMLDTPDASIATSGFWMWDRWLRTRLMPDLLALKQHAGQQQLFGALSIRLIKSLFAELENEAPGERSALVRREGVEPGEAAGEHSAMAASALASFEPGAEFAADGGMQDRAAAATTAPAPPPYRIFTRDFDRVIEASEIATKDELRALRAKLDQKHSALRREIVRLAAKLQRKLLVKRLTSWDFDLEEGLLDAARLDRAVVNPGAALAYKLEKESEFRDTVVALLIDCSGSMRNQPIEIACLVADMACAALERCGVSVEVLGYTTSDWRGGESALQWARSGRPPNPGRLNDLRHVVFKSADQPYRRARNAIAAMLQPELLKENIDGEALEWAADRLRARREQRKILLVVSDGAPADQATIEDNADRQLLDRHLRGVIAAIEKKGDIGLLAVGLKHDVTRYYRTSTVINKADALGPAVFSALTRVFD